MPVNWFAYQSKPNKEEVLCEQLRSREIETYYPWIRVNPVNPRSRRAIPYFPGYVFIRVDLAEIGISALQFMPFARGLVSFDHEPAVVPDHLLAAIRKRVDEVNAVGGMEFDGLAEGSPIYIADGPFRGYEAIFDSRLPGTERVRVLIQLLSKRYVPVEMGVGQVRAVPRKETQK
jgi:transcriptional antiterminator RfaH